MTGARVGAFREGRIPSDTRPVRSVRSRTGETGLNAIWKGRNGMPAGSTVGGWRRAAGEAARTAGVLGRATAALALSASAAHAQEAGPDSGDTAWMLTSTALVLMMTVPGLAMFYAGMVRKKNVLAMSMQVFATCCLATLVWMVVGYSLAFGGEGAYLGGFGRILLNGMTVDALSGTIPESVFMTFQMTFAIITPALISGAFADRMKFAAMLWFMGLWGIVVYAPIAHWVWGAGGWIGGLGALDFAGGTVVHINCGIAGLVAALVLGRRLGYGSENMAPHNLTLSVIGASLLWVGWFGFNAGSALAANGTAGMAMAVTQIATAAAALAWMFVEWARLGKPSVLGILSGAVAGLVAITPAAGFVDPKGALIIGLIAGIVCFWAATSLKHMLGYDDALDAFGIHGVGGIVGALLTGVFAAEAISGRAGVLEGNLGQILPQVYGVLATVVWCGIGSFVLLKLIDATIGLRVSHEVERDSLDLQLHGETVQ
jgi:Amt family ammonium transporter